ncbi:MgtC/SapB family protein [Halorussus ruber]|uniref:MgtC/SapB family protein n=1 Tax=Halorussus ruber TaxID=1126238 RepID=UPI0010929DCC|nr:MgtC/SapB family protein [Halorussus ruber]
MVQPATDSLLILAFRVFVAFAIGALVGLEREQAESGGTFAGSRTFPLFAVIGALVYAFFPALLPVAVGAITLALTVAYAGKIWIERDIGLTTLTAAILTIFLGALTTHSERGAELAVIVGGAVTVLLSAKDAIHDFVDQVGEEERRATSKFILVAVVVLPVLPDRELDVLAGLNPQYVWLMVVFVTGLSFAVYVLSQIVGPKRGIALTGIVGGFVSSTATTVSMAEQTADAPSLYHVSAFSIVVASTVMFPRAVVEVAFVNPALLPQVVIPLGAMTITGALVAAGLYWRSTTENPNVVEIDITNPFRLRTGLFFGVIFALVLLVSESADTWFGVSGVYVTAFVSGLADVDAITLTLSTLAREGSITPTVATTGIVIGAIANTLVKAGLVWVLGTRQLGKVVTGLLGLVSVVGIAFAVI